MKELQSIKMMEALTNSNVWCLDIMSNTLMEAHVNAIQNITMFVLRGELDGCVRWYYK